MCVRPTGVSSLLVCRFSLQSVNVATNVNSWWWWRWWWWWRTNTNCISPSFVQLPAAQKCPYITVPLIAPLHPQRMKPHQRDVRESFMSLSHFWFNNYILQISVSAAIDPIVCVCVCERTGAQKWWSWPLSLVCEDFNGTRMALGCLILSAHPSMKML